MGQLILDKVIGLLQDGGIRAAAAFPAESMQRIAGPVAAVSLEKADLKSHTVEVLVEILTPKESGGYTCQKKALEACAILEEAGAVCCQNGCDFMNKTNLFRVPVKAVFRGTARYNDLEEMPKYTVITGALTLPYVCDFSAKQVLTSTGSSLQSAPWEVTVEEFFPWGVQDTLGVDEPFELRLRCMGNVECYEGCKWTSRERIAEELGIRQIRKAKATGRSITSE